jgi:hypothetical protein
MSPQTIMLCRHGEKPEPKTAPHGVNVHGEHDEHCLSVPGWVRAGGLAGVFANSPMPNYPGVVRPHRTIATRPNHENKSTREVATIGPTARRLELDVEHSLTHGQEKQVAQSILSDDRDALVVWHHGTLPDLAKHFPLHNPEDVPKAWPEDRFDLIWVLQNEGDAYRFSVIPQMLLPGDRSVTGSGA